MPLTYTGRRVKPGGIDHPSWIDIAVGQSRAARFAGQTRRWYSVLDHVLFMDEMVVKSVVGNMSKLRLSVLMHDAHEAMTADVPTDWKTESLRLQQIALDHLIMGAHYPGGMAEYKLYEATVKHFDRRALVAEARVVGPPVAADVVLEAFGVTEDTPEDVRLLQDRLYFAKHWFAVPPLVDRQEDHPGVKEYLRRVMNLL
jgi:hypothetical protein